MIKFKKGNILLAETEALVNTVNTVGVMGKGIALQFKEHFKENYKLYKKACEKNEIDIGKMFVTSTNRFNGPKYIINFPTKKHWRSPSKIEYIQDGMQDLLYVIKEKNIKSISIPPLGSGNGGLNWVQVKSLILNNLSKINNIEVIIYEPSQVAYDKSYTKKAIKPKLTSIRAMVLSIFNQYNAMGYRLSILEGQKLVYFLQRLGEELRLEFVKHKYGPYAQKLIHVMYDLEGHYLSGMKFKDAKRYDPIVVLEDRISEIQKFVRDSCSVEQKRRLHQTYSLIEGFESPLGMELLSTVDYVLKHEVAQTTNLDEVQKKVLSWNSRKKKLIQPSYIEVAYKKLMNFKESLYN